MVPREISDNAHPKGGVNKVFCGQCQELILDLGKAKMVIARTQRFYSLNFLVSVSNRNPCGVFYFRRE